MPSKEYPIITGPTKEEVIQSWHSHNPPYGPDNAQGVEDYDTSYAAIFTTPREGDPHAGQPISVIPEHINEGNGDLLSIEGQAELIPANPDETPEKLGPVTVSYDSLAREGLLTVVYTDGEPEQY